MTFTGNIKVIVLQPFMEEDCDTKPAYNDFFAGKSDMRHLAFFQLYKNLMDTFYLAVLHYKPSGCGYQGIGGACHDSLILSGLHS